MHHPLLSGYSSGTETLGLEIAKIKKNNNFALKYEILKITDTAKHSRSTQAESV